MKFPVPKTLFGAFLPLAFVNSIFGVGVIEYPPGKPRPIISAFWSIINFSIYISFMKMAHFSELAHFSGSSIVAGNYRTYAYIFAVFIAVSLILTHIKSKTLMTHMMKLKSINDRLERLGIPKDYDLNFKAQVIHYVVAFIFITVIIVLDFIYIPLDHRKNLHRICFLLTAHHWVIFNFIIDSGCINSIRYFKNRFERLNRFLTESNLHKLFETGFNRDPYNRHLPLHTTIMKEIYGNQSFKKNSEKQGMIYVIRESRKIHRDLCNTATNLNDAFGIPLLFSLALAFAIITALIYNCYVLFMDEPENWLSDEAISRILPLLWVAFYSIKVFLLFNTSWNANSEAKRTGQLIHTLLNSTIIYNKSVRDELKIFSLQILQNPLQLSVCGFFTVDHELASAMLGSVSTFVIIMIQMRSVYET